MRTHLLLLAVLALALGSLFVAVSESRAQTGASDQTAMMTMTPWATGTQHPDPHGTPVTPWATGTHEPDPHMTPDPHHTPSPGMTPGPTATPRGGDTVPPTGGLVIDGGAQVTNDVTVTLTFTATDNPGGTGVAWMMIREWGWDMGLGWHDMHPGGDCGGWTLAPALRSGASAGVGHMGTWQPYTNTVAWQLSPRPGVEFITVWFADAAWNVSQPATARINLVPQPASVRQGEGHHYRYALQAGQAVTISLRVISGDPDLYVWQPGHVGAPDWVSNARSGDESVSFVAPVAGVYLVEVRGYTDAVYELNLQTNNVAGGASLQAAADKPLPAAPLVTTAPDVTTNAPQAGFKAYVPLLER